MEFALHIVSGPSAGTKIVVKAGETVSVGRTDRSRYVIGGDSRLSGCHFQIEASEEEVRIKDLGSTNGTFLNGSQVNEAVLREGDQIIAGDSRFVVRVIGGRAPVAEPPPAAARPLAPKPVAPVAAQPNLAGQMEQAPAGKPRRPPKPLPPEQDALLALLREKYQPLYALLDAARDPKIVALLRQSKEQYQSLYEGPQAEKLALFAPYLVRLGPDSPVLEALVRNGWGKSWGVYLTCQADFSALRRHLRHFLKATLPDGRVVSFRFYDPRVLRVYLPSCNEQEATRFFGPIVRYALEDEGSKTLLEFAQQTGCLWLRTADLASGEPRAPVAQPLPVSLGPPASGQATRGTLQVRPEQMQKFSEAAVKRFEGDLASHLKEFFPERCEKLDDQELGDFVRLAIERARRYAITAERHVSVFADVMFVLGPGFETRPENEWAAAILSSRAGADAARRVLQLRDEAIARLRAGEENDGGR